MSLRHRLHEALVESGEKHMERVKSLPKMSELVATTRNNVRPGLTAKLASDTGLMFTTSIYVVSSSIAASKNVGILLRCRILDRAGNVPPLSRRPKHTPVCLPKRTERDWVADDSCTLAHSSDPKYCNGHDRSTETCKACITPKVSTTSLLIQPAGNGYPAIDQNRGRTYRASAAGRGSTRPAAV